MSAIIKNNDNIKRNQLRKNLKIDVPRFNTNYMRNSVARRRAIVWNTLVHQLNDDIDNTLIEKDHLGDWSPEKDCC